MATSLLEILVMVLALLLYSDYKQKMNSISETPLLHPKLVARYSGFFVAFSLVQLLDSFASRNFI